MDLYIFFAVIICVVIVEIIWVTYVLCCECPPKKRPMYPRAEDLPEVYVVRSPAGEVSIAYESS